MKNAFIDNCDVDSENGRRADKWKDCDLILRERKSKCKKKQSLWNEFNACLKTIQLHHILCTVESISHIKITFTRSRLRLPRYTMRSIYIYAFKLQTKTCVFFVLKTSKKTNNIETNLSTVHQISTKELVHGVSNSVQSTYSNELLAAGEKNKCLIEKKNENKLFSYMVEWIELERFIFTSARCECTLFRGGVKMNIGSSFHREYNGLYLKLDFTSKLIWVIHISSSFSEFCIKLPHIALTLHIISLENPMWNWQKL